MNNDINILRWNDPRIMHRLWVEKIDTNNTRLCLQLVEDSGPKILYLDLHDTTIIEVLNSWNGHSNPVSPAYQDDYIFEQVRCLLNLPHGSVLWSITHIKLPNTILTTNDRLQYIPGMHASHDRLQPIMMNTSNTPSLKSLAS